MDVSELSKSVKKTSLYYKLILTLIVAVSVVFFADAQENNTEEINTQDDDTEDSTATAVSTTSMQLYYTSNYIFRDYISNFQAIQPSATYTFKNTGLSFSLWTSAELAYQTQNIEINPSLYYSYTFKNNIAISLGAVYYLVALPGEFVGQNLTEFFGSFSPTSFPLSPTITIYYSDTGYLYSTLAVSQSITGNGNGISAYGWLGYRNGVSGERNGIKELVFGVNVPVTIRKFSFSIGGILTHLPHALGRDTYGSVAITVGLN